jgi:signal transduction histidine kinase
MLEEGERLTRLVNALLTLSRADHGRIALHPESIDLAQFAGAVVDELSPLAEEKGQSLTVEAASPVSVSADRDILRHALGNLVDNAVKYSPNGASIRVVVRAANGSGTVEVIDHGPGIPPEHRAKVFERFYRVDKGRARVDGGSGLGLAIVRWAVEAHGGSVEVRSEVGAGSTFRLALPMISPDAGMAAASDGPPT